jgi:hypothetical protein
MASEMPEPDPSPGSTREPPSETPAHLCQAGPPEAAAGLDLDERERRVLAHLPVDGAGRTGFEGLRRRLDLHPQSLTRVVDRLAHRDLVASDDDGYYRPLQGREALASDPPAVPGCPRTPVAAGTLPPTVEPDHVRDSLSGRWFDGLRWYGWRNRSDGSDLLWLTEGDHALVLLRLTRHRYVVAGEPRDPTSSAHPSVAAAPLVAALGEVVGDAPGAPS